MGSHEFPVSPVSGFSGFYYFRFVRFLVSSVIGSVSGSPVRFPVSGSVHKFPESCICKMGDEPFVLLFDPIAFGSPTG